MRRQRAEIDALLAQLDAAVEDLSAANAALAPIVPEVVAEARQSSGAARDVLMGGGSTAG